MSKDFFDQGNRIVRLEALEKRMALILISTATPKLSIDDVILMRNGSFITRPRRDGDPKLVLLEWCRSEKKRVLDDWGIEMSYHHDYPDLFSASAMPDTSFYDDFIRRVEEWTMVEALKVVKIFEDLDALEFAVLRLTPEAIHRLLEDT